MLNPLIVEAVVKVAKEDARLFFQEFQQPLEPTATEWDTTAWQDSRDVVEAVDEEADPAEYWEVYSETLVAETQRLADEFEQLFVVDQKDWSTVVDQYDYYKLADCEPGEARFPVLKLVATTCSSDEEGIVDDPVSDEEVRRTLSDRAPGFAFDLGEWDAAEYPFVVRRVKVRPPTPTEKTVLEIANACGLEVIRA
jgi:hypothetical protein